MPVRTIASFQFKILTLLLFGAAVAILTETPACAQRPRVYRDRVEPHWLQDNNRFWYRNDLKGGQREFILVDSESGVRQPAIDHAAVAKALSRATGTDVHPAELPINSLEYSEDSELVTLEGPRKSWTWNIDDSSLQKHAEDGQSNSTIRLFLPPRSSGSSSQDMEVSVTNELSSSIDFVWVDPGGSRRRYARIESGKTHQQHTYIGHVWVLVDESGRDLGAFSASNQERKISITDELIAKAERRDDSRRRRQSRSSTSTRNATSPDGRWTATVQNHNLQLTSTEDNQTVALTMDGTSQHTFQRDASRSRLVSLQYNRPDPPADSADLRWSPDSEFLLAFQTDKVQEKEVFLVESSPKGSLQPTLQSYPYAKPGDEIPIQWPRLFSVIDNREVPLDRDALADPWQITFLRWSTDGQRFWLLYNQRGHQRLKVIEVNCADGSQRIVVDETSDTFIQYSTAGKFVLEWLRPSPSLTDQQTAPVEYQDSDSIEPDHLLWASERSGWNHLYRYDLDSGLLANAVTSGEWNVRRVEHIDQSTGQIWFYAVGLPNGQDPYHEHFCRVNSDGAGFTILTSGDGTHDITWSPDRRYFLARYSRVDLPPITELRRADDGTLICELERADASEIVESRGSLPERFFAKGRDGHTDIWGLIHRPRDFDPSRQYPVVENIYAGPHDHHVPKAFRSSYRHQHQIADRGFIVVQIDGMGTAWRSKEFHDVCYKNLKDAGFPDRILWMQAASEKFPQMDLTQVGIYGGSAGGQNAMAALLWHGEFYKAAVADCGCHDNRMDKIWWNEQWMGWPVDDSYKENSNMENADKLQGNLMLVVGELDRNVDPATTTQVVRKLIEANKSFDFVLVPGAGHGACETPWASRRRADFLVRHLQGSSKL